MFFGFKDHFSETFINTPSFLNVLDMANTLNNLTIFVFALLIAYNGDKKE